MSVPSTLAEFRHNRIRVATNLKNMKYLENSGNFKNCQNLRENSGKYRICGIIADEMYSTELFCLELPREKSENDLEVSEKAQGIWLLKKCGHPEDRGHHKNYFNVCWQRKEM